MRTVLMVAVLSSAACVDPPRRVVGEVCLGGAAQRVGDSSDLWSFQGTVVRHTVGGQYEHTFCELGSHGMVLHDAAGDEIRLAWALEVGQRPRSLEPPDIGAEVTGIAQTQLGDVGLAIRVDDVLDMGFQGFGTRAPCLHRA